MEYLQAFTNHLEANGASKITIKNYLADVRKFIRFIEETYSRSFQLSDFTADSIKAYKASLQSLQTSISSQERYLSSLRKFATFLHEEHKIPFNPFTASQEQKPNTDTWALTPFKQDLLLKKASELTIKNYVLDIKQFVSWLENVDQNISKATPFSSITTDVIEEYKNRLVTEMDLSPLSVNRKLSSIRRYVSFLIQSERLTTQPLVLNTDKSLDQNVSEVDKDTSIPNPVWDDKTEEARDTRDTLDTFDTPSKYSSFAPVRLSQKMQKLFRILFDTLLILPIIALLEKASLVVRKSQGAKGLFEDAVATGAIQSGRSLFSTLTGIKKFAKTSETSSTLAEFIVSDPRKLFKGKISNLSKAFYAPLSISTENMPRHKKILHHLRYTRPNWYKKYHSYAIAHYLNFAIMMIFITVIGASMYSVFFDGGKKSPTLAAYTPNVAPPRILSFQGRLTDSSDNPITTYKNVRFAIYEDVSASGSGHLLWQELQGVTPDADGVFSVLMGNTGSSCGSPLTVATGACAIPSTLFTQNATLYLGITIENDSELSPRQQVASVAYATNSETLQGLAPISGSNTTNVVLALDSAGNLTIGGSATPTFQASGGQFTLSGTVLNLTTTSGSNSNVQVNPDGSGKIDLQKAIINSSLNGPLTTAAGAVQIDDLFAVNATSSGQSAFTLNQDSTGPLISASTSGTARFTVGNNGSGYFAGNLGVGTSAPARQTEISFAGSTTGLKLTRNDGTGSSLMEFANTSGVMNVLGYDAGTNNFVITNNSTSQFAINRSTGNVGVGTTTTSSFKLEVAGNVGPSADVTYDLGSASKRWNNIYAANIIGGSSGVQGFWQLNSGALSPYYPANDLLLGSTATSSAKIAFINIAGGSPTATFSGNFGIVVPTGSAPSVTQNVLNGGTFSINTSVGGGAGTSRFFITNNGNVGVGTTSPTSLFTINQAANTSTSVEGTYGFSLRNQNTTYLTMGADASNAYIQTFNSKPLILNNQGNNIYTGSGSMGIGTTAVGSKLQVNGSAAIGYSTSTAAPANGLAVSGNVGIGTTTTLAVLHAAISNSAVPVALFERTTAGTGSFGVNFNSGLSNLESVNAIRFTTGATAGTGGTERMKIDTTGNVGIGSTTPGSLLDLSGGVGRQNGYTFAAAGEDSLIVNGDFEQGQYGWTASIPANATVVTGGYSGNNALQVTGATNINSNDYIPVDPVNDVIQLEAYLKKSTAGTTPGLLYFGYYAYDASKVLITTSPCGTYCYFAASGTVLAADGNWHKYSATTTGEGASYPNFPVGTKYIRILGLINYSASSDSVTLIDHVSLRRINNGPLFVGNNFSTTNLVDQTQVTKLYTTATNQFIITPPSSGNVGIGTTTTPATLSVSGTGYFSGNVGIGTTTLSGARLSVMGGNVGIGTTTAGSALQVNGGTALGYSTSTAAPTNGLAVSGNVGIGTTTASRALTVTGDILGTQTAYIANGQQTYYAETYSVPTATNVNINLTAGNSTLSSGMQYRVVLSTTGTSTNTGAVYLVYQTAVGTWTSRMVSANGTTSNHPLLGVSGTNVYVYHNHASTYSIRAQVFGLDSGNATNTATTYFGLEGELTNLIGNIGVGTTAPVAKLDITGNARIGTGTLSSGAPTTNLAISSSTDNSNVGLFLNIPEGTNNYRSWMKLDDTTGITTFDATYTTGSAPTFAFGKSVSFPGSGIWNGSGNIGIGSTTPAYKLDVVGGSGIVGQFSGRVIGGDAVNSNEFATLGQIAGGAGQYWQLNSGALSPSNSTFDVLVGSNATASALIKLGGTTNATSFFNTGGNVGIGTTGSVEKLQVAGNIRLPSVDNYIAFGSSALRIQASNSGGNLDFAGGTQTNAFRFWSNNMASVLAVINDNGNVGIGTSTVNSKLQVHGSTTGNSLVTFNQTTSGADIFTASAAGTTRFVINYAGNVGIGSSIPQVKLDVNGNMRVSNNNYIGVGLAAGGDAGFFKADVSDNVLLFTTGYSKALKIDASSIQLNANGGTGNVGIGTTTVSAKLHSLATTEQLRLGYDASNYASFTVGSNSSLSITTSTGTGDITINPNGNLYLGSAGTDALFLGRTDANIPVVFNTLGGEAMRFTNGNLGIGTTAPTNRIQVSGSTTGNALVGFNQITAGADIFTASASGTTRFVITNAGNVGIGTTSPSYLFDVQGGSGIVGQFSGRVIGADAVNSNEFATLGQIAGGAGQYWQLNNGALSPFSSTADVLIGATATASAKFGFINVAGGTPTATISGNLSLAVPTGSNPAATFNVLNGGSLNFQTALTGQGDGGLTSRLFIKNDGNIGIGTTTPTSKLFINTTGAGPQTLLTLSGDPTGINQNYSWTMNADKSVSVSGGSTATKTIFLATATSSMPLASRGVAGQTGNLFQIENSSGTALSAFGGNGSLGIGTTTPLTALHVYATTGGNAGAIIDQRGTNSPDIFTASASGTTRFVITNVGNVGIGSSLPTAKLDIAGDASTSGSLVFNGANKAINILNGSSLSFATSVGGDAGLATKLTLLNSGNFGIGSTTPAEVLDVVGDIKQTNTRTRTMTRTVPTTVNDEVDIGSFALTNGGGSLWVSITVPSSGFSVAKEYLLPIKYNQTAAWTTALPTSSTGSYSSNDFDLDVNITTGTASLRIRRTLGSTAGTAYIVIRQDGINTDAFTASTATSSVSAPTSYFGSTALTQVNGNVGIGTTAPVGKLNVVGLSAAPIGKAALTIIQNESTDIFAASAGATTKFVINSAGNVGIGTSLPSQLFDVQGGSGIVGNFSGRVVGGNAVSSNEFVTYGQITGGLGNLWQLNSNALSPINSTYDVLVGSNATASALIKLGGTTNASSFFNTGGTVGIGTTSTSERLVIGAGNILLDNTYGLRAKDSGGTTRTLLSYTSANNLQLSNGASSGSVQISNVNGSGSIQFLTGASGLEAARIDATGNLGIGTTTPFGKLNVVGNATTPIGKSALVVIQNETSQDLFTASAGATTRFVITNTGNVGIGSSIPAAALDVVGQVVGGFGAVTTAGTTDWNDITNSRSGNGYTLLLGSATNGPSAAGSNYFHALNFEYSSKTGAGNTTQIAIPYSNSPSIDQGIYLRGRYSGTWGNWVRVISENTSGNVGIGTTSPFGKLNVVGSATSPTGKSALVVIQNETSQDLFTASAGATTRFTISNGGDITLGGSGTHTLSASAGTLQIGAATLTGTLNANSNTITNATSYNGLVVTANTGVITTGTWNGSLIGSQYGGTGANLSSAAQGAVPYFSATGVMSALAAGTSGQVLMTNGASANPSWVDIATLSSNYWAQTSGSIYTKNATLDLLIGGSATTSAKFGLINVNSGTPTATISGNLAIAVPSGSAPANTYSVLNGGTINFRTSVGGDAGATSRLYIANNGNLGVGTTNPIHTTEVIGTTLVGGNVGIEISGQTIRGGTSASGVAVDHNLIINANSLAGTLSLQANSTTQVYLDGTSGNLGLAGVTNPSSFPVQSGGSVGPNSNNAYDLGSTSLQWRNIYAAGSICFAGGTDCTSSFSTLGVNYWNLTSGTVQPKNATVDLLIGGTATTSAKFGFINVNSGTPTATISGNFGLQVPTGSAPAVSENILNGGTWNLKTSVGGDAGLTSRLTILNNGNLGVGTTTPGGFFSVGTSSQFIIGSTGIVTAGTWNGTVIGTAYGGLGASVTAAGAGEILYSSATTTYGHLAAGTSGQALISGGAGAPSWANTNTSSFGLFDLASGAIYPKNATNDLLIGGSATTSAKFGFINVNSGTPTATVSSNFSLQVPTGSAPAVAENILNGGTWTLKNSVGGDAGLTSRLTLLSNGNLGVGTTTPGGFFSVGTSSQFIIGSTGIVTAGTWNGTAIGAQYGGTGINTSASTGVPSISSGTWSVAATLATSLGGLGANVTAAGAGEILYSSATTTYGHLAAGSSGQALISGGAGAPSWANTNTSSFGLWDTASGELNPKNATLDLLIGGTATTSAKFGFINVNSGSPTATISGNFALAVPTGSAPAITLSAFNGGSLDFRTSVGGGSGTSRFLISNDGTLTASKFTLNGGLLYTDASGVFNQTPIGSNGQCLQSIGGGAPTWGSCGGLNYWTSTNGALYPTNATLDLLIGGTATSSSKFAFTNVNSGTPTFKAYNSSSTQYVSINHDGTNANITASTGTINIGAGGGTLYVNTDIKNDSTNYSGFVKVADKLLVQAAAGTNANALAIFDNTSPGDILTASASGTTKFVIDGSGNVGIGTTLPGNLLSIISTASFSQAIGLDTNTSTKQASIGFSSAGSQKWQIGKNTDDSFYLYDAGNARTDFSIASSGDMQLMANGGNVGIGTTTPVARLNLVTSGSNPTGKAAFILNQVETNADLLTASASGTTKFKLTNGGSVVASDYYDLNDLGRYMDPAGVLVSASFSAELKTDYGGITLGDPNIGAGTSITTYSGAGKGNFFSSVGSLITSAGGIGRGENFFRFSEQFDKSATTETAALPWVRSSTLSVATNDNGSCSSGLDCSPDGQQTAEKLTGGAGTNNIFQTYNSTTTEVGGNPWTFSVWIKNGTATGTVNLTIYDGFTTITTPINMDDTVTNRWNRYFVSMPTPNASAKGIRATIDLNGNNTKVIYVWGAQLEKQGTVGMYVRTSDQRQTTTLRGLVAGTSGPSVIMSGNDGIATPSAATLLLAGNGGIYNGGSATNKNILELYNNVDNAAGSLTNNSSGIGFLFNRPGSNGTTNLATQVASISAVLTTASNSYAGALTFATANAAVPAERMRIDATGNIGIGTTTTSNEKLEVAGAIRPSGNGSSVAYVILDGLAFRSGTAAGNAYMDVGTLNIRGGTGSTAGGTLNVSQNAYLASSGGNVGIGTTTVSSEKFRVISNDNVGSTNIADFLALNETQGIGIGYANIRSTGSNSNIDLNIDGKGTGNLFLQGTATGNVGIGTTTATSKLYVKGTVTSGISYIKTGAADARISVGDPTKTWSWSSGWSTAGDLSLIEEGVAGDVISVKQGGNVGIGVGASAYKLSVNGDVNIAGNDLYLNGSVRLSDSVSSSYTDISPQNNQLIVYNGSADQTFRVYNGAGSHNISLAYSSTNYGELATTNHLILTAGSGNIGVGTTAPTRKISAWTSLTGGSPYSMINYAGSDDANEGVLLMGIKHTTTTNTRFIKFFKGISNTSDSYAGATGIGNIHANNTNVVFDTTGTADLGEYMYMGESVEAGDIISQTRTNGMRATQNSNVVGVISRTTSFMGSSGIAGQPNTDIVGYVGKILTKVSTANGPIHNGDIITASSIPGVGQKATKVGQIVGKALEDFDPNTNADSFTCPTGTPDGVKCGKIVLYVNVSWYDPDVYITDSGNLNIAGSNGTYTASNQGSLSSRIGIFASAAIAQLKAGIITVSELTTQALTVTGQFTANSATVLGGFTSQSATILTGLTTNSLAIASSNMTIAGQSINDFIDARVNSLLDSRLSGLTSPLASSSATVTAGRVVIKSPIATSLPVLDVTGNASISGTLATNSLTTGTATISGQLDANQLNASNASISGTLHATNIIADNITSLSAQIATLSATTIVNNFNTTIATMSGQSASSSADFLASLYANGIETNFMNVASLSATSGFVPTLNSDFVTVNQGLIALGPTSLADTSIAGTLSINGNLILSDSSINVLGADLQIQPLRQGGVSFEGGQIAFDTDGNMRVSGDASFGKNINVAGSVNTRYISALPGNDLNVNLPEGSALAVNNASGSAVFKLNQIGDVIASGSGTFKELLANGLNIVRGAQADDSITQTTASGSAGTAIINAYQTERTINTPYVTAKSLIYITPTSDTQGVTPYVSRQTAEDPDGLLGNGPTHGSFTIEIPNNISKDIKLNWWIVN